MPEQEARVAQASVAAGLRGQVAPAQALKFGQRPPAGGGFGPRLAPSQLCRGAWVVWDQIRSAGLAMRRGVTDEIAAVSALGNIQDFHMPCPKNKRKAGIASRIMLGDQKGWRTTRFFVSFVCLV